MPFYSNRSRGPKARGCATRKHASSNADYGSSSVRRVPSGDVEGDRPEGIALQMEKMRGDLRFWCVADPKDRHCFVTQWLRASLIPNETDPAHSSRMCVSWLCRSQISSPRHARVWENDTPPEAGPQWRAGSLVRQAEASEDRPGWWVLGMITLAPSRLASLQQGGKDVVRGATGLLQRVPPHHWHGCRDNRSFVWLCRWFGRHVWHASDRAMVTRMFRLAPSIEQPGESLRGIAWWARGLRAGKDRAETGRR